MKTKNKTRETNETVNTKRIMNASLEVVAEILAESPRNITHYHVLLEGKKRATVVDRDQINLFVGDSFQIRAGYKDVRGDFVELGWSAPSRKPIQKPKAKDTPRKDTVKREGSGYVAAIDALLLDVQGEAEGLPRSRYTAKEAISKMCAMFPHKDPKSARNVVRVRPRILEKIKGNQYDEKGARAPRWKLEERVSTKISREELKKMNSKGFRS